MQTKVGLTYVTTAAPLNTFNTTTKTNTKDTKDMKDNNGSEAILTLREHLQQLLSIIVFDNNKKIKIRKKRIINKNQKIWIVPLHVNDALIHSDLHTVWITPLEKELISSDFIDPSELIVASHSRKLLSTIQQKGWVSRIVDIISFFVFFFSSFLQ